MSFHPWIERWFAETLGRPTDPQGRGWEHIARGRDTLIAAPTGSGKTLAAFLYWIDRLLQAALSGQLEDRTYVVYVSPLKALGNDIHKNLQVPLGGVERLAATEGVVLPEIRLAVRSGDTPTSERQAMIRRPPHILITTPESLYILLTAESSRRYLRTAEAVIVDEIHAVAGDKRGSHLALSLERLDDLAGRRLQRIGLSATQKPIEEIGRLLVGADGTQEGAAPARRASKRKDLTQGTRHRLAVVDVGHRRDMELAIEVAEQELGPIATHELWEEIYDRIATHARRHRTTLVFVNTRRLAERMAHRLTLRLGEGKVAAHHGSLSRQIRLEAEHGLKSGEIPVVVATASLELGIDIGHVDLVCHIGAPRALANLLQRVGRSGHAPGGVLPKGILFPLTRDELLQSAAAVRAARAGELDRVVIPHQPLDILAQQMVAAVASREMGEEDLYALVTRAYPFRGLTREAYEEVLAMLSEGIATRRGRRSALIHRDRVNGHLRARRGARLAAITSGGAIPDTADFDVVEEPAGTLVGRVNEDFAIESQGGDIFLLGNRSWRIRRVEAGRVRVEDAHGAPPSIPFWLGEAPARTAELSQAVSGLRRELRDRLTDRQGAIGWLERECGLDRAGAEQALDYVAHTVAALGDVPTQELVVAERFFDESGGMQLVVHAPFGGRINRAWALALRKRFCVTFDFELQAAATDDGFVLSLGEQHSFPVDAALAFVRGATLREDLIQALLAAPMFTNRWRWNASRALALPRFSGGRRVPMPIQRMRAEDLLAAVFPAQVMCQDNRSGPVEVPDHPLVRETVDNCLYEWMDLEGLGRLIGDLEAGRLETRALDTAYPSPMSHEILNANPYAFLDDAPLEERRARAVSLRRTDPELAGGLGALDRAAIEEVRRQAWPEVRDADELHDALLTLGLLPEEDAREWGGFLDELVTDGRAALAGWGQGPGAYLAAERLRWLRPLLPDLRLDPSLEAPPPTRGEPHQLTEEDALRLVVGGWMEALGPTTASGLASRLGLSRGAVERGLALLEGEGTVLQGRFTPGRSQDAEPEWCDRRLLSRIHRLTLNRLRREIEAVSAADFLRFLFRWQHAAPGTQLHGPEGLLQMIGQLQGLELPAPAWERDVLPARVAHYRPADLDALCLSGQVLWARLRPGNGADAEEAASRRAAPTRSAPLGFVLRQDAGHFLAPAADAEPEGLSGEAGQVADHLRRQGASFLEEIAGGTGLLAAQVEEALWELVAQGLVTGDGLAGLRLLLASAEKRHRRLRAMRGGRARQRLVPSGRWSLLRMTEKPRESAEFIARQLLRRYGVVFRELLARETRVPPWRELLRVCRSLEARGELRGGRFVAGFVGEQFALPEAVEVLRAVRRRREPEAPLLVPAADPLNLVGILTPGGRVSPLSHQVITYRDGVPVDVGQLGAVRHRLLNVSG